MSVMFEPNSNKHFRSLKKHLNSQKEPEILNEL
jgi:hypothetical protein